MILIPQKLFAASQVKTILRDGNVCILTKNLTEPIVNREGYISNHVISILLAGEQHLKTYDDQFIKVRTNEVLFIPRGMYYISDLIPKEGTFKSLLFYFDDSIIQEFLATSKITEITKAAVPNHLKFGVVPTLQLFAESLISIYQTKQLRRSVSFGVDAQGFALGGGDCLRNESTDVPCQCSQRIICGSKSQGTG